jgi:predicted ATP-grasp superfamily ATP-dependent carboligase
VNCLWLKKIGSTVPEVWESVVLPFRREVADRDVPRGTYLQEYIDGVPMSALFCSDSTGVHLFGMSLQLIGWPSLGASGFLFCGNVGPVDPGPDVTRQVLEAAQVIVDSPD